MRTGRSIAVVEATWVAPDVPILLHQIVTEIKTVWSFAAFATSRVYFAVIRHCIESEIESIFFFLIHKFKKITWIEYFEANCCDISRNISRIQVSAMLKNFLFMNLQSDNFELFSPSFLSAKLFYNVFDQH